MKIKEPKRKIKVLTKEEMESVYNATTNIRDEFLIKLLFETRLRIGEALSLFIEDIIFDHNKRHRIKLVDRGEFPYGASLKTGEREMNDNNKDAIIASLKRKIKRIEEENKELREQLKINYADIYKQLQINNEYDIIKNFVRFN